MRNIAIIAIIIGLVCVLAVWQANTVIKRVAVCSAAVGAIYFAWKYQPETTSTGAALPKYMPLANGDSNITDGNGSSNDGDTDDISASAIDVVDGGGMKQCTKKGIDTYLANRITSLIMGSLPSETNNCTCTVKTQSKCTVHQFSIMYVMCHKRYIPIADFVSGSNTTKAKGATTIHMMMSDANRNAYPELVPTLCRCLSRVSWPAGLNHYNDPLSILTRAVISGNKVEASIIYSHVIAICMYLYAIRSNRLISTVNNARFNNALNMFGNANWRLQYAWTSAQNMILSHRVVLNRDGAWYKNRTTILDNIKIDDTLKKSTIDSGVIEKYMAKCVALVSDEKLEDIPEL